MFICTESLLLSHVDASVDTDYVCGECDMKRRRMFDSGITDLDDALVAMLHTRTEGLTRPTTYETL